MKNNIKTVDFALLEKLLKIKSPSGEEKEMKHFILNYLKSHSSLQSSWKVFNPRHLQDSLILIKGKPKVAVFVHMDTTGFTTRYENQLLPIGSPEVVDGTPICGTDSFGPIDCKVYTDQHGRLFHDFKRSIDPGTSLIFKSNYIENSNSIEAPYLDNRIGIFISLILLSILKDGLFLYSCWEEHGGGSVANLTRIIYEDLKITRTLILDVTWVTDGIASGKGAVISLRDRYIPRREYIDTIRKMVSSYSMPVQFEVEGVGSSDGGEIQRSSYPVDWCFIGPPVENTHSPNEKVHKKDIISTLKLYDKLINNL